MTAPPHGASLSSTTSVTRREHRQRQVVGAAHERQAKAAPLGPISRGTSERTDGQGRGEPDPLERPGRQEWPVGATGSATGSARIAVPHRYDDAAEHEQTAPAEPIDERTDDQCRGDLDEAAVPTISPICGSGTPARASASGSVAVKPWNPACTAKRARASRSIASSSAIGRARNRLVAASGGRYHLALAGLGRPLCAHPCITNEGQGDHGGPGVTANRSCRRDHRDYREAESAPPADTRSP